MKPFLLAFLLPLIASAQLVISPAVNNNPFSATGVSLTGSTAAAVGTGMFNGGTSVALAIGGTKYFEVFNYTASIGVAVGVSTSGAANSPALFLSGFGTGNGFFGANNNTELGYNVNGAERLKFSASGLKVSTGGTFVLGIRHGISGAMTAGAVTVTDAGATTNTRYFLTPHTLGTVAVPSSAYVSSRSAGASFVITSAAATDTSTWDWLAIEP